MKKPDVSVIIPIYNAEKYLAECLDSVREQTKKDIEIICIDDCSTDSSADILENYAKMGNHFSIIRNKENRGRLYARKLGVMNAGGNYIMFLDADDFLDKEACEIAYHAITKYDVDVLQFGVNIINSAGVPQFEVDFLDKFLRPYEKKVYGEDVLRACFAEEKYSYNLWNKIVRSDICKKAFACLDDAYYCMAEDMMAYFALSYYAKSYIGIPDLLYHYHFGIGISKPGELSLEELDRRCASANSIEAIEQFLYKHNVFKKYEKIYAQVERRMLSDNFEAWYYRLPAEMRAEGYKIYEKYWGKDKVIRGLLYDIENKQNDINQKYHVLRQKDLEIEHIKDSISYKIGYGLTWLPKKIFYLIKPEHRRVIREEKLRNEQVHRQTFNKQGM